MTPNEEVNNNQKVYLVVSCEHEGIDIKGIYDDCDKANKKFDKIEKQLIEEGNINYWTYYILDLPLNTDIDEFLFLKDEFFKLVIRELQR